MSEPVLRVAAKAVIVNDDGKVLIVREAATYDEGTQIGRYGLPGGRLNPGERYEDGLHREVEEETGLTVEPQYPLYVGEWHPDIKGIPHQIIAIFMVCKAKTTEVHLSSEHDEYLWIDPTKYADYNFMTPDDEVIARLNQWQQSSSAALLEK
ncbi:MAG: 7,8-dihydro-8-oxoguanine triphosphatase [Candidatus Saccharibacteria bacterium]|nr:7,8-dihydro-8-oxoguanine triphosphatase [Candidatus Saccharibacteria bacterium]